MEHYVFAFALVFATALAQDIEIKTHLRDSDAFDLEVIRVREDVSGPPHGSRTTTPVHVRVVEATAQRLTLEWSLGETSLENAGVAPDPVLVAASRATRGVTIRFVLNATGEFGGVVNAPEMSSRLRAGADAAVRELTAVLPPSERDRLQARLSQVLLPGSLVTAIAREPRMYFGLHGRTLTVGSVYGSEVDMPPTTGDAYPVRHEIAAMSVDATSAVITTASRYEDPARGLLPLREAGDEARYLFDRELGLMREVVLTSRSTREGSARLEQSEIRLISEPRR